ncbi:MAG: hypothetical protein U0354_07170 [Candidatus Sericytochromatia bacterium]
MLNEDKLLENNDDSKKFKYAIIFELLLRGAEIVFNILISIF